MLHIVARKASQIKKWELTWSLCSNKFHLWIGSETSWFGDAMILRFSSPLIMAERVLSNLAMAFIILALLSSTRIAKATRKKFLAILSEFKISLKFCRPNTKDWLAEFPLAGIQRTWNYSSQSKSVFNILKSSHSPPNTSRLIPTHPDGWDAFGLELVGLQPHPTCWSRPHS